MTKTSKVIALAFAVAFSCTVGFAKEWTIEARQEQLMQDINTAQKASQLTTKEAKKLRSRLANVARKKTKMIDKASNKDLNENQKAELESLLNEISVDIKKFQLDKRAEKKKKS